MKTKCRTIKYCLTFCELEHQNKLSGIAFADLIGKDKTEIWQRKLKRLLNLSGLCDISSVKTNNSHNMNYLQQRLSDIEQHTWIGEIHNNERNDPNQKTN